MATPPGKGRQGRPPTARARRREQRRARLARRVVVPAKTAGGGATTGRPASDSPGVLGALSLSALGHVGLGLWLVATASPTRTAQAEHHPIRVTVHRTKAPAPPPNPAPIVVPDAPRTPAPTKRRKARPRARRPLAAVREDPPAPTTAPQPAQAPAPIVTGLSLEATVAGGRVGATFAAGHTRLGQTAQRAHAPARRREEPATLPTASAGRGTRVAAHVPGSGPRVVKPRRIAKLKPAYPAALKARQLEGDVVVVVKLDRRGRVTFARVANHLDEPQFGRAALAAARRERFAPATRGGTPIPYTLTYTYRFRIDEE